VLIPCRNAEASVEEAIGSILAQTYKDIEVIAVDDASTDGTRQRLEAIAERDPRVVLVASNQHLGAGGAHALASSRAQGSVLVVAHADDIALPGRLARQVGWLDDEPDCDVVAGRMRLVSPVGRPIPNVGWNAPEDPEAVRFGLMIGNCVAHPTVALRRSFLERAGGYGNCSVAEDYELWLRSWPWARLRILAPPPLVTYRYRAAHVRGEAGTSNYPDILDQLGQYWKMAGLGHPCEAALAAIIDPARAPGDAEVAKEALEALLAWGRTTQSSLENDAVTRRSSFAPDTEWMREMLAAKALLLGIRFPALLRSRPTIWREVVRFVGPRACARTSVRLPPAALARLGVRNGWW